MILRILFSLNTSTFLTLLAPQYPTEQHHHLQNSIWSHFLTLFWYGPVRWDPAEPWVMMTLPAVNSFIHHLLILLTRGGLLCRPPLFLVLLLHQKSMINCAPFKWHRLANTIWYLSLQDSIDFWEIMQKMKCHVWKRAAITCAQEQGSAGKQTPGHTHALTHTLQVEESCSSFNKRGSLLLLWKWVLTDVSTRILQHIKLFRCLVTPHNGIIISDFGSRCKI